MRRKRTFLDWMWDSWVITLEAYKDNPNAYILIGVPEESTYLVRVQVPHLTFLQMLGLRTPAQIAVLKVI